MNIDFNDKKNILMEIMYDYDQKAIVIDDYDIKQTKWSLIVTIKNTQTMRSIIKDNYFSLSIEKKDYQHLASITFFFVGVITQSITSENITLECYINDL